MEQPFGLERLSCTWAALHPCASQCWTLVVPESAVPVTKAMLAAFGWCRFGIGAELYTLLLWGELDPLLLPKQLQAP